MVFYANCSSAHYLIFVLFASSPSNHFALYWQEMGCSESTGISVSWLVTSSRMSANMVGFFSLRTQQFANDDMVRDWITDENGNVPLIEDVITSSDKDCIQAFTSNRVEITKIRLQTQLLKPMERRSRLTRRNSPSEMGRMDFKALQRRSSLFLLRNIPCFLLFLPLNRTLVDYLTPNNGTCPLMGFFLAGYGAGMASTFMSRDWLWRWWFSDTHWFSCNTRSNEQWIKRNHFH